MLIEITEVINGFLRINVPKLRNMCVQPLHIVCFTNLKECDMSIHCTTPHTTHTQHNTTQHTHTHTHTQHTHTHMRCTYARMHVCTHACVHAHIAHTQACTHSTKHTANISF